MISSLFNRPPLVRLLLLLAICLVFGRILLNDFVDWDDFMIFGDFGTAHPAVSLVLKHWIPSDQSNFNLYCPMIFTVWWLLAHLAYVSAPDILNSSLNPQVYHAANLLVHWLSALVTLEILRKLRLPTWAAAIGALIFAIHPLQTEPVAWATGMKDLLSGLLALLAIWQFMECCTSTGRKFALHYAGATAIYILALLSKPSTVSVPLIAVAIGILFYHLSWKRIILWTLPWFVLALAMVGITRNVQQTSVVLPLPIAIRPLIAADSLSFYLYKLVLPINLSFDYGRTPQAVMSDPTLHHPLMWTWIFPVAVALLVWRSKSAMLKLAALIFLFGLLPVLGLLPFFYQYYSTVADRYVYLSMLGVAIAGSWLVEMMAQHKHHRAMVVGSTIILVALGCLSFVQAGVWHDSESLYTHALSLNHTNWVHYDILGNYYDRLATADRDRALDDLKFGDPKTAHLDYQQSEDHLRQAIAAFRMGMAYDPNHPVLYDVQEKDYVILNQPDDGIALLRKLIEIQPQLRPDERRDPAIMHGQIALIDYRAKRLDAAAEELRQNPDAITYLRKTQPHDADPDFTTWLNNLSATTQPK